MKYLLLIPIILSASCAPHLGQKAAGVSAYVGERVDFGAGVTKSTDGWWYVGLKLRGKQGAGADAVESDLPWGTK